MKNAVVFTGLPRMRERFERSVSDLNDLERQGLVDRILFVTWKGRLDNEELRDTLTDAGVEVIEKEEAPVGGTGNIWHQMRALDFGLRELSSDYHVLKTRSDVRIEKDFLERLLANEIPYRDQPAGSGVFDERLWVPFFTIGSPFYLCDYCFFGQKTDMQKLVNFDARFDFLYHVPHGLPEVRRYFQPYISEYPFMEAYLTNYTHDRSGRLTNRYELFDSRLNSPVFGAFLAFYYKAMMSDFYFKADPVTFKTESVIGGNYPVDAADIDGSFLDNFRKGSDQEWIALRCQHTDWLEAQFGDAPNDDVPQPIREGVERPFDDWADYEIRREDLQADIERDRQYFDVTAYPTHSAVVWLSDHVLAPLGLKEKAKQVYRSAT